MPSPSEHPILTTQETLETQSAGREAALQGATSDACPWRPGSDRDRTLTRAWVRGWASGRTDLRRAQTGT